MDEVIDPKSPEVVAAKMAPGRFPAARIRDIPKISLNSGGFLVVDLAIFSKCRDV